MASGDHAPKRSQRGSALMTGCQGVRHLSHSDTRSSLALAGWFLVLLPGDLPDRRAQLESVIGAADGDHTLLARASSLLALFGSAGTDKSGSKLHALHTLRDFGPGSTLREAFGGFPWV